MRDNCSQNNEPSDPNDERGVIMTSLILFVLSTTLRHIGKSLVMEKGKTVVLSAMLMLTSFQSKAFNPYTGPYCFLLYEGDTLVMDTSPLSALPAAEKEVSERLGFREKPDGFKCYSPLAQYWEIRGGHLFLLKVDSECYTDTEEQAALQFVFEKYDRDGKIAANWFTGSLYGLIRPVTWILHSMPVYRTEKEFLIANGEVTRILHHDNSKSKRSIYADKPQLLSEVVYSKINWSAIAQIQGEHTRVFLSFTANENGMIDSVHVLRGLNEQTDKEAVRVVKLIPEWFVVFQHGRLRRVPYNLPIDFSEETRRKYQK